MTSSNSHKQALSSFERSYRSALKKHMIDSDGSPGSRIGRRAVQLAIGTLELARVHERSVAALMPSAPPKAKAKARAASIARADSFFTQAVAPTEQASCGHEEAAAEIEKLTASLGKRTAELTAARAEHSRDAKAHRALKAELKKKVRQHVEVLARSRQMQDRLRNVSHKILAAQEAERLRISRDLHDAIGQVLTGINVGLAALKNDAATESRVLAGAITRAQQLVAESMRTVHQFAWELRPTLLDDLGLVPAVRSYAKAFAKRTGVKVRFTTQGKLANLDQELSTALFRVAQGALLNIERHADAKIARVILRGDSSTVQLEITDDGKSFNVKRMDDSSSNKHLGLVVMRERVEMVGGRFSIASSRGRGTTVRCVIPIAAASGE